MSFIVSRESTRAMAVGDPVAAIRPGGGGRGSSRDDIERTVTNVGIDGDDEMCGVVDQAGSFQRGVGKIGTTGRRDPSTGAQWSVPWRA
jgi:hypothetical protein